MSQTPVNDRDSLKNRVVTKIAVTTFNTALNTAGAVQKAKAAIRLQRSAPNRLTSYDRNLIHNALHN